MRKSTPSEYTKSKLTRVLTAIVATCCIFGVVANSTFGAASEKPTTVAEATKVLDLSKLPLIDKAEEPQQRRVAELSYSAAATVEQAAKFHRAQFLDKKWQELPGSYNSAESANATFSRDGYLVSLMVYSSGEPGKTSIVINQHGNVDLNKLPIPAGVKPFYSAPVSTAYVTDAPLDAMKKECRKLLMEKGWQPYGDAGDVQFFKQNAILLSANVQTAPAQMNKTVITYSTELISADIPAPADAVRVQYSDNPTQVSLDTKASLDDVVKFYRETLTKNGWKATTDKAIRIDFKDVLIFRNPQKEMITLEANSVDGLTRLLVRFQTAAEVEDEDRRAKEAVDKAKKRTEAEKMKRDKPGTKLAIAIPSDAKNVKKEKDSIEFVVPNGKARGVVEAWRKQFAKEGWKEDSATVEDMAGVVSLAKDKLHLVINYTDTGFLPAEIDINAIGIELEAAGEKKADKK